MLNLKAVAGMDYKITLDESVLMDKVRENRVFYYRIPCKYGFINVHNDTQLAAYTNSGRIAIKLMTLENIIKQRGDKEVRVLFTIDRLREVCNLLKARKKRKMSPENREKVIERFKKLRGEINK
jgi:hypothetical protein